MDSDGNFVVAWNESYQTPGHSAIKVQRYDTDGTPRGAAFQVSSFDTRVRVWDHSVAMDADGDFVVAWGNTNRIETAGSYTIEWSIRARRYTADGVAQGNEFAVTTTTAFYADNPSVAMDSLGGFVVTWYDGSVDGGNNVFARRFNAAGAPQGAPFQVNSISSPSSSTANWEADVAMDPLGNFVVTWAGNTGGFDDYGIYARRYDAAGTPLGGQIRIDSAHGQSDFQFSPHAAINLNGEVSIVWQRWDTLPDGSPDRNLYARRVAPNGVVQGGEIFVASSVKNGQLSSGYGSDIVMDAGGNFTVAWVADNGIFTRRYKANGVPTALEYPIALGKNQISPSLAMDADGNYVVSWGRANGSGYDVYGRLRKGPDLTIERLAWHANFSDGGGIDIRPSIFLDQDATTTIDVYWAVGDKFEDRRGSRRVRLTVPSDQDGNVQHVTAEQLGMPPIDLNGRVEATGILVVIDPPLSDHDPSGDISEIDDDNNTAFLGRETILAPVTTIDDETVEVLEAAPLFGTIINARFRPAGGALSLEQAAAVFDIDHFNWVQHMIVPDRWGVSIATVAPEEIQTGLVDGVRVFYPPSTNLLVQPLPSPYPPLIDPLGPTQFYRIDFRNGKVATVGHVQQLPDAFPYYLNEPDEARSPAFFSDVGAAGHFSLAFSDNPTIGVGGYIGNEKTTFITELYGVGKGGNYPPVQLTGTHIKFQWRTNGISVNANDILVFKNTATTTSAIMGGVDAFGFDTEPLNQIPTVNPIDSIQVRAGDTARKVVEATDSDAGQFVTFTLESGPSGAAVDAYTGEFTWMLNPNEALGDYEVAVRVSDNGSPSLSVMERFMVRVTPALVRSGAEVQVNSFTTGDQFAPAVAMDARGEPIVVWESYDANSFLPAIHVQRFNATGMPEGSEFQVSSPVAGGQQSPAVAIDSNGTFVVVWSEYGRDGDGQSIHAQRYTGTGAVLGTEFRVNTTSTGDQSNPSVAMNANGDWVVTWESNGQDGDGGGIFAQLYSAAGTPRGSEFRVNEYITGNQSAPSVAMDSQGDFVIVWTSYDQPGDKDDVCAQRYYAGGALKGSHFQVNSYTTDNQDAPAVAMDSDGDFVVTWQSKNQDGSMYGVDFGVYAQRYSSQGMPQGIEYRVNQFTTGRQGNPTVAMDAAGDYIITWCGNGTDAFSYGVYASQYDAAGTLMGNEIRVDSISSVFSGASPSIAIDPDGDGIVCWPGYDDGYGYGIYAQYFASSPHADTNGPYSIAEGSAIQLLGTTSDPVGNVSLTWDLDGDGTFGETGAVAAYGDEVDPLPTFNATGLSAHTTATVTLRTSDGDGRSSTAISTVTIAPILFEVTSIEPTASGFVAHFNHDLDDSVLNLYEQGGSLGAVDLELTGTTSGVIRGSVVVGPDKRKLTFVRTGDSLPKDLYTIEFRSGSDAFRDENGRLLEGTAGSASGNFIDYFNVREQPPDAVSLSIPDFIRGFGQSVDVPANSNNGLPITISTAQGVSTVNFTLSYDPQLLNITGASLDPGITGILALDLSTPGQAIVSVTSPSQLRAAAGATTLLRFTANVPATAPYAAKHVLNITDLHIFDSSSTSLELTAIDSDGIHVAAYFGDTDGSRTYSAPDATFAQQIIVGTNAGLASYQLIDPYLLVDITGNGAVQANDVTQIQRAIVGLPSLAIPALPGLAPAVSGGPDPVVSIPQNLTSTVGESTIVPVEILVTEPTGITLADVDIAIAYDASTLELIDTDVGRLLIGFDLSVNTSTPGVIRLTLGGSPLDLAYAPGGVLATFQLTELGGAGTISRLNLLQSAASQQIALYDVVGRALTLSHAPANGDDEVDGLMSILGNGHRNASWELSSVDTAFGSEDDFTSELLGKPLEVN